MRITPALLCFSIIFFPALAADGASPTDTYLSARDRFIAAHKGKDVSDGPARAEIERLLRRVVPAFTAPGFSAGELNLNCLDDNDAGFSALDGLAYSAGETSVVYVWNPFVTGTNRVPVLLSPSNET